MADFLEKLSRFSVAHLFYPMRAAQSLLDAMAVRIAALEQQLTEARAALIAERARWDVERGELLDRAYGLPPGREAAQPQGAEEDEDDAPRMSPIARIRRRDQDLAAQLDEYLYRMAAQENPGIWPRPVPDRATDETEDAA